MIVRLSSRKKSHYQRKMKMRP